MTRELGRCAECGCCWFNLRLKDGTEGGVSVDTAGRVGARTGDLRCRDCGAEFVAEGPPAPYMYM